MSLCGCLSVCQCVITWQKIGQAGGPETFQLCLALSCMLVTRAVRYHPKFAYHDILVLVSRYTLGIDTLYNMAYAT